MIAASATTPTCTTAKRGILLPCLACGEANASMLLHLNDGTFTCQECDANATPEEIRAAVQKWERVLNWAEKMPPVW